MKLITLRDGSVLVAHNIESVRHVKNGETSSVYIQMRSRDFFEYEGQEAEGIYYDVIGKLEDC